jgi:sodium transport system permease protein
MKLVWLIFKKEMLDVVRNRRRLVMILLFNMVILPMLAILPSALLLRRTITSITQPLQIPVQGAEYAPDLLAYIEKNRSIKFVPAQDVEALVRGKQASVGLIVPADYAEKTQSGESSILVVVIDKSKSLNPDADRLKGVIETYEKELMTARLADKGISLEYLNPIDVQERNVATDVETTASQVGLLIPGFIITFGLTSGLSVAIGSVAGEKDRQTLEPVLFTPVSRAHLVLGKLAAVLANVILSATVFTLTLLITAVTGFFTIMYFLRSIPASAVASGAPPAVGPASLPLLNGLALPGGLEITLFFLSALPVVLLGAALQTMISSFARNSDEGFTFSLPLSLLSMVPLFASFFLDDFKPELRHYATPIFGTILAMRDLLGGHIYTVPLLIMFISSILWAVLAIQISIWLFSREDVLFRT